MTKPIAIIRADATNTIGGGHIVRCTALADVLTKFGWKCIFASTYNRICWVTSKRSGRFHFIDLPSDPSKQLALLRSSFPKGVQLMVVDHYDLDIKYESACRPWAERILVIEDLVGRIHDTDFLLDQTHGCDKTDYQSLVPNHCVILTGAQYALLRQQFIRSRLTTLSQRDAGTWSIKHILVSLGTTDPHNVTATVLAGIRESGIDATVNVVLGSRAPHLTNIRNEVQKSPRMVLLTDVENMATAMSTADLAFGAGGVTSWERCCLGLPTVSITTAENQQRVNSTLESSGAIKHLGKLRSLTPTIIANAIKDLTDHPEYLEAMSRAARVICDARGPTRLLLALTGSHQTSRGESIDLRLMEKEDEAMILDWQSSQGARQYMRIKEAPDSINHREWMKKQVHDPSCLPMIVRYRNKPTALLRLDHHFDNKVEVSILVKQDYRGLGIAKAALQLVRRIYQNRNLWAEIHPDNISSLKAFSQAGFQKTKLTGWYKASFKM